MTKRKTARRGPPGMRDTFAARLDWAVMRRGQPATNAARAKTAGLPLGTYLSYRFGVNRGPGPANLKVLAKRLGVSPAWLAGMRERP